MLYLSSHHRKLYFTHSAQKSDVVAYHAPESTSLTSWPVPIALGNFSAIFGVWSDFLRFWQLWAIFAFPGNFWTKCMFRTHIKRKKGKHLIENVNFCEFLEYLTIFINLLKFEFPLYRSARRQMLNHVFCSVAYITFKSIVKFGLYLRVTLES